MGARARVYRVVTAGRAGHAVGRETPDRRRHLQKQPDLLLQTGALFAVLWLANPGISIGATLMRAYLTERLSVDLRRRVFAHCETLSVAFSQREHSGRTSALFVNDVPSLTSLLAGTTVGLVGSVVVIVLAVAVMVSLNWQFALAGRGYSAAGAAAAPVLTRPLRPATRRAQAKAAELSERLQENLTGMRELIAFGRQHSQALRLGETLQELLRLRMRVTAFDTTVQTGQSLFSLAVTLVIMGYGGYLVIAGQTSLGTLVAMQSLFGYVFRRGATLRRGRQHSESARCGRPAYSLSSISNRECGNRPARSSRARSAVKSDSTA